VIFNGEEIGEFDGTVADLLADRGVRPVGVAVAVDGEIVPRSQWIVTSLRPTSAVEVVTAAAGG
jgi:sulfur carrier protein